jgi:hypothetical protein
MHEKGLLRAWSTPVTIGAFLLMAGTGILMFFGYDSGLTTVTHQWFSWLFVAGAAGHVAINFRPFRSHLKSMQGRLSSGLLALVLAGSCFSWGIVTGPRLKAPVELALVEAPITALAGIIRTSPEALLARLEEEGFAATGDQSVRAICEKYGVDENRVLGAIFLLD